MDIFLLTNEEKEQRKLDNEYRSKISSNVKKGNINLLEYSYLIDFYETKGSLVNSDWFLSIVTKINDRELDKTITKIFDKIFTIEKNTNKLVNKIASDLEKNIINQKKDVINFNSDQKEAIKRIFNFLPNIQQKCMGLYGYAGTGKTTIIVEIISFLLKNKLIKSVAFAAPTNQAVDVIKCKFQSYMKQICEVIAINKNNISKDLTFDELLDKIYSNGVKIDFITVHKLLKFEIDYSSLNGEMLYIKNNDGSLLNEYELIVIDECSMIQTKYVECIFNELKNNIQKASDNFKKIPKIIFCGDPAQLPPVNEKTSIIFYKDKKDFTYDDFIKINKDQNMMINVKTRYENLIIQITNMQTFTLTEVMRSKSQSVTNVCYEIRQWVIGLKTQPNLKEHIDKNENVIVYRQKDKKKTDTSWFKKCLKYHKTGNNRNIILTWTNEQCDEYNNKIRNELFKFTLDEVESENEKKIKRFEIGDVLVLNGFYGSLNINEEKDDKDRFKTSEQLKVLKITVTGAKIKDFSSTMNSKALKLQNYKYYDSQYKKTIEIINKNTNRNYLCWKLTVSKVNNKDIKDEIHVLHEKYYDNWKDEINFISEQIKTLLHTLVSKFREKKKTIENNIIKPLWRELHKNVILPFANVSYGYAITCHKGQGTDFYNVFVDTLDITKNVNDNDTKKCLYTAMTRTSNELHLLL